MEIKKHQAMGMAGLFVGNLMASIASHFTSNEWRILVLLMMTIPAAILMASVEIYFEKRERRKP